VLVVPDKQCPCGSGKKISACCGQKGKVIDLNQYRWRRAGRHLRRKLAEFADHEMFVEEAEIAREYFFSVMDQDLVDDEDDLLLERFFEWFIFDYRIREQTLIEYFSLAGRLTSEEKELLEKWKVARSSFYQVLQVDSQSRIVLEDLVRGDQVEVNDGNAVQELEQGHILLMRILSVGEDNEFSTGGLVLPPESKNYIISRVKLDAELYWKEHGNRGNWDNYLRDKAHVLNALVVEVGSIWGVSLSNDGADGQFITPGEGHFAGMAQQVTNIFLDYFYDRWINEPMDVLQGKTPMEASRTKQGREKLQTLLQELGKIEKARAQKGEPFYDLSRLRKKLRLPESPLQQKTEGINNNKWACADYDGVAALIKDGLEKMGYRSQIKKAVELWEKYSSMARPTFRKPGAWAAAVIYAVARLLGDENIRQNELADMYNVSASTISSNYRSICRTLQLNG
jgi:hypothetical protein